MSMLRSLAVSSPKPAANRSRLVSGSSKKTAVARKSPLEKAASQTFPYSSSGDFAYRIASLVAFNAANVRAILVFTALELPAGNTGLRPTGFMRGRRLNGRYWRPEVAIQSKCLTNIAGRPPKNYGSVDDLSAMCGGGASGGQRRRARDSQFSSDEIRTARDPPQRHGRYGYSALALPPPL